MLRERVNHISFWQKRFHWLVFRETFSIVRMNAAFKCQKSHFSLPFFFSTSPIGQRRFFHNNIILLESIFKIQYISDKDCIFSYTSRRFFNKKNSRQRGCFSFTFPLLFLYLFFFSILCVILTLKSFHAEADLLLSLVEVNNLCCNLLSDGKHV